MGGVLGEIGKKIAERWLTLLVLPGVLYMGVAATAWVLGHGHALDLGRLTARITLWVKNPAATTTGGQVVLLVSAILVAAGAGLVAQTLGSLIERVALAAGWRTWPAPLRRVAAAYVRRRNCRWTEASQAYERSRDQAALARARGRVSDPADLLVLHRERARIALEAPDRPTWCGDRVHAVATRLLRDVHLDIGTLWPVLWLHLPDTARGEVTSARNAMARAAALGGWACLYSMLAVWWWPAILIAVVAAATAWSRFRAGTEAFAQLLESAVRLHAGALATHLGLDDTGLLDSRLGDILTKHLRTRPLAS